MTGICGACSLAVRNVVGKAPDYNEVFLDEGDVDMVAAMRSYKAAGFDGVFQPDHVSARARSYFPVSTLADRFCAAPLCATSIRLHGLGLHVLVARAAVRT